MEERVNSRGHKENRCEYQHLHLPDLKTAAKTAGLCSDNQYLDKVGSESQRKSISPYPRPEFHVAHLKHDTGSKGLTGIQSEGGFRVSGENLLWWSLYVTSDDIKSAERRLLDEAYPQRTEEQAQMQQPFLEKFASSPAFLKTSRYGSYRFIFPLNEVLDAYSKQFCSDENPVMKVLRTTLYKQEVVYAVLVHSPANEQLFSEYPLLTDEPDSICAFRDGCFIWRPEAMCETHRFELIQNRDDNRMEYQLGGNQFYLWDHVAIALHMEDGAMLQFDSDRLKENLRFCTMGKPIIKSSPFASPDENFDSPKQAQALVTKLWPLGGSLKTE